MSKLTLDRRVPSFLSGLASLKLSDAQARVLCQVADGVKSPSAIAKNLSLTASSASQTCKDLWRRKLLTKRHHILDSRRVAYRLSADGIAAVKALAATLGSAQPQPPAPSDDQA